jgi:hypothetical protein
VPDPNRIHWTVTPWHRKDPAVPIITRTWMDPCPHDGREVTGFDAEAITVRDNPQAVIGIHNPACQWDEEDPDSPDCICTSYINPAPDPMFDTIHVVGYIYTLRPCGHQVSKVRIYSQEVPEPGTLGALMAEWGGVADDDT